MTTDSLPHNTQEPGGSVPDPERTLAIVFGASEWPSYHDFHSAPSFRQSAIDVIDYLRSSWGLSLPSRNVKVLFDSFDDAPEILRQLHGFIRERRSDLRSIGKAATDLLIYYVGHGGFADNDTFFLSIRATDENDPSASSIAAESLGRLVREGASGLRTYLILDCCFASSLTKVFMTGGPLGLASVQLQDALPPHGDLTGYTAGRFPIYGTALLCASGPRDAAKAPHDLRHTMFTGALLEVLRHGDPASPARLSLDEIRHLVQGRLQDRFAEKAVLPQVHSPQQRVGRVDLVPLFPNPAQNVVNRKDAFQDSTASTKLPESQSGIRQPLATLRPTPDAPVFPSKIVRQFPTRTFVSAIVATLVITGSIFLVLYRPHSPTPIHKNLPPASPLAGPVIAPPQKQLTLGSPSITTNDAECGGINADGESWLVMFEHNSSIVTPEASGIIEKARDFFKKCLFYRIEINGYDDTSNTEEYSFSLSVRRAEAVAAKLVQDGVPQSAIFTAGFGHTHLLVPTGPGVREPQNRRVEIIVRDPISSGPPPPPESMNGAPQVHAMPGSELDLVANVGDRVFFSHNSSTLKSDAKATLDRDAVWLTKYKQVNIEISGNTDDHETSEENSIALGLRRAQTVQAYLEAKGIDPSRIAVISYGRDRPTDLADNEQARAQNRSAIIGVQ